MKPPKRSLDTEKAAFAKRLTAAITDIDDRYLSPSALAKEFNLRSKHGTVSINGAHKWLTGESIPQQRNLILLADWFDVDVNWLRFGDVYEPRNKMARDTNRHMRLVTSFSALTERDKTFVEKMVRELLRLKA